MGKEVLELENVIALLYIHGLLTDAEKKTVYRRLRERSA